MSERVIICESCGSKNRVDENKLDQAKCGNCQAPLKFYNEPVEISDASFENDVVKSKLPVLVDFWAPWCGPCLMIAPSLKEVAKEKAGMVKIAKMNTDENPQTPSQFGIMGIPTLILFREGKEVGRLVGAVPKGKIIEMIEKV